MGPKRQLGTKVYWICEYARALGLKCTLENYCVCWNECIQKSTRWSAIMLNWVSGLLRNYVMWSIARFQNFFNRRFFIRRTLLLWVKLWCSLSSKFNCFFMIFEFRKGLMLLNDINSALGISTSLAYWSLLTAIAIH